MKFGLLLLSVQSSFLTEVSVLNKKTFLARLVLRSVLLLVSK